MGDDNAYHKIEPVPYAIITSSKISIIFICSLPLSRRKGYKLTVTNLMSLENLFLIFCGLIDLNVINCLNVKKKKLVSFKNIHLIFCGLIDINVTNCLTVKK